MRVLPALLLALLAVVSGCASTATGERVVHYTITAAARHVENQTLNLTNADLARMPVQAATAWREAARNGTAELAIRGAEIDAYDAALHDVPTRQGLREAYYARYAERVAVAAALTS
jgi:hypothetical protein